MLLLFCGLTGWRLGEYADEMAALSKQAGSGRGAIAGMIEGVTELVAAHLKPKAGQAAKPETAE